MAPLEMKVMKDDFSVLVLQEYPNGGYECWNVNGGRISTPVGSTVYVEYKGVGSPFVDGRSEQYWEIRPTRPDYPGEWATFAGFFWKLEDAEEMISKRKEVAP